MYTEAELIEIESRLRELEDLVGRTHQRKWGPPPIYEPTCEARSALEIISEAVAEDMRQLIACVRKRQGAPLARGAGQ
jgi:hypothetical protein